MRRPESAVGLPSMFCPSCKDEFRAGFTRCAACNVDLVEDLSTVEVKAEKKTSEEAAVRPPSPMADYCGFFTLDEARQARNTLRRGHIRTDIVVREAPGSDLDKAPKEEFWLRVESARYTQASKILDADRSPDTKGQQDTAGLTGRFGPKIIAPARPEEVAAEPAAGDHFLCSECGHKVAMDEPFCPGCGVSFEDE